MKPNRSKAPARKCSHLLLAVAIGLAINSISRAGEAVKWEEVPKAVRETILAQGGKEGPVDKEREAIGGQAVYEAQMKNKEGVVCDLVITADGKLVEVKTDDAADAAAERADRAKTLLATLRFTHPTAITNPYLPLSTLEQDILEGNDEGEKVRVERTAKPDMHKTFQLAGQDVEALVFEDREFRDGKLAEVTLDYFAQDDNGNVYYLGEEVDEYESDKVVGHDGSWLVGKDTPVPGVLFPANPVVGMKFRSEDVSSEITELDEIVSVTESTTVPAGQFTDCVKVKETTPDGVEYKLYAKHVGVVRETPPDGDELLVSHVAKK